MARHAQQHWMFQGIAIGSLIAATVIGALASENTAQLAAIAVAPDIVTAVVDDTRMTYRGKTGKYCEVKYHIDTEPSTDWISVPCETAEDARASTTIGVHRSSQWPHLHMPSAKRWPYAFDTAAGWVLAVLLGGIGALFWAVSRMPPRNPTAR